MAIGVDEPSTPQKTTTAIIQPFSTPPTSPATASSSPSNSITNSKTSTASSELPISSTKPRRAFKRERSASLDYSPPSSDSFDSSSCSSTTITPPSAPKRRGRPPKTETRPISPTELQNMDASDARYVLMRNKNNEASRRSRINRKDREQTLESIADALMAESSRLQSLEQRLEDRVQRLKEALKASMLES